MEQSPVKGSGPAMFDMYSGARGCFPTRTQWSSISPGLNQYIWQIQQHPCTSQGHTLCKTLHLPQYTPHYTSNHWKHLFKQLSHRTEQLNVNAGEHQMPCLTVLHSHMSVCAYANECVCVCACVYMCRVATKGKASPMQHAWKGQMEYTTKSSSNSALERLALGQWAHVSYKWMYVAKNESQCMYVKESMCACAYVQYDTCMSWCGYTIDIVSHTQKLDKMQEKDIQGAYKWKLKEWAWQDQQNGWCYLGWGSRSRGRGVGGGTMMVLYVRMS